MLIVWAAIGDNSSVIRWFSWHEQKTFFSNYPNRSEKSHQRLICGWWKIVKMRTKRCTWQAKHNCTNVMPNDTFLDDCLKYIVNEKSLLSVFDGYFFPWKFYVSQSSPNECRCKDKYWKFDIEPFLLFSFRINLKLNAFEVNSGKSWKNVSFSSILIR